jgi:hypothetical protein
VVIAIRVNTMDNADRVAAQFAARFDALAARHADVLMPGDEDAIRPLAVHLGASFPLKLIDCGPEFSSSAISDARDDGIAVLVIHRNRRVAAHPTA